MEKLDNTNAYIHANVYLHSEKPPEIKPVLIKFEIILL